MLAAVGAVDLLFFDERLELVVVPARNVNVEFVGVNVILGEVVRSVARLAVSAVHQGIGEPADVTGRLPRARVHQNGAVHARVVGVFLYELFPPGALDVVFQLRAQGTVIPCVGKAAVNFASREDETSVFAERDEFIHGHGSLFIVCHNVTFPSFLLSSHYRESARISQALR